MGITATEDHFESSDLVPDLLPSFNPCALMTVTFPGVGPISPGQNLSRQQTAGKPDVTYYPRREFQRLDHGEFYPHDGRCIHCRDERVKWTGPSLACQFRYFEKRFFPLLFAKCVN